MIFFTLIWVLNNMIDNLILLSNQDLLFKRINMTVYILFYKSQEWLDLERLLEVS